MANEAVVEQGNADKFTVASCDDVKNSGTDESCKDPSDDAELDDILEGTLKWRKIT